MSKPGYVGLLLALAFTTATLPMLPAHAEQQQPATPSEATPAAASASPAPADEVAGKSILERYQDGIVIWQTPDDVKVPFSLKF
jgi:hypothetical protein